MKNKKNKNSKTKKSIEDKVQPCIIFVFLSKINKHSSRSPRFWPPQSPCLNPLIIFCVVFQIIKLKTYQYKIMNTSEGKLLKYFSKSH